MKSLFGGGYSASHDDDAAADHIGYFDHVFNGALLHYSKDLGVSLGGEGNDDGSRREITLTCKQDLMELAEKVGIGVNERDRILLTMQFKDVAKVTWDHQHSTAKLELRQSPGSFLVLEMENSLELEQNLGLRYLGAVKERLLAPQQAPQNAYIGMFAGPTKPKPFERKRANLTTIKQGKMPPLTLMRQIALDRHRGSERPVSSEVSKRKKLALDHIHDGVVGFTVFAASGAAGLSDMSVNNARLVLDDDGASFTNDVSEVGAAVASTTTRKMTIPYADVASWAMVDNHSDVTKNGINLTCADGKYCFAVEDVNFLRVTFEFFLNNHRTKKGLNAQPGTTHGRQLVGIHTLMGEVPAPTPTVGQADVLDEDGAVVRGKPVASKRRGSAVGSVFGGSSSVPPAGERPSVRSHWKRVVSHNGWLLKKGGATKSWMKRYFVLYRTSQGHFLSYYAEYWDSPLYNPSRKERNMIDLSKITYLRAKSKHKDVPPFSFDVATIEREWTLSCDSHEQLQQWLQMIAGAVDTDVAIVPDDTLSFAVKARSDPSKRLDLNDYSTTLQISAWGVSVQKVTGAERDEVHFWCYTDFYKWSILRQNGKLALSLQIFTSGDFKQKADFVFRSLDAQAIATAIEYYIEKFMSRMHLRRELDEVGSDGQPKAVKQAPAAAKAAAVAEPAPDLLGDLLGGDDVGLGAGMAVPEVPGKGGGGASEIDWASDDEDDDTSGSKSQAAVIAAPTNEMSLLDLMSAPAQPSPAAASPFAAAPPAPPPASLSLDPFAAAPPNSSFGAAGASSAGSELLGMMSVPSVGGVEPEVAAQMPGWFGALVATEAPGVLFKNSKTEILYKHEFRGSQARVMVKQTNLTASPFSNVSVTLEKAEPQLRSAITPGPGQDPSTLAGNGGAATYTIMVECNQPFGDPPMLVLQFSEAGGRNFRYDIPCPVVVTSFMNPAQLQGADFLQRWDRLVGPGLEASTTVPSTLSSTEMTMVKLQQLKLGVAPQPGPDGAILCASTLQVTGEDGATKSVVGCMIKVSVVNVGSAVITVRTSNPKVTPCLSVCLSRLVSSR